MIEYIFDIDDHDMVRFVMSEKKEDVEHQIISLMKRVLDYFEIGLDKLLLETTALGEPIPKDSTVASEYRVIERSLLKYPEEILTTQMDKISELKNEVDKIGQDIHSDDIVLD